MGTFIHEKAIVESSKIGEGSRIWAFVHILPDAQIGKNANICDFCFIENEVIIGDNVTIKCGVYLWDGVTIEDDVHIGANATFTNDIYPRSNNEDWIQDSTILKKGCSIGANATILPKLTIGSYAMIGAGAVVTRDVPDYAIVVGNPARIHGYVCVCSTKMKFDQNTYTCSCGRSFMLDEKTVTMTSGAAISKNI